MLERLHRLHPFQTPETRRLATLFAVVYFAQGMWTLPVQTLTLVLKERGLSSAAVADFFLISTIPWLLKPAYGLLSDFVPLFGLRRKSYFVLTSGMASLTGFALAVSAEPSYWRLALLYTAMGFGLAFTDVLTDAVMVESGKPRGLTGAFQAVQWASISVATLAIGVLGGELAERRSLHWTFLIAAGFPLASFVMAARFLREERTGFDAAAFRSTWASIRAAATHRQTRDGLQRAQPHVAVQNQVPLSTRRLRRRLGRCRIAAAGVLHQPAADQLPLSRRLVGYE